MTNEDAAIVISIVALAFSALALGWQVYSETRRRRRRVELEFSHGSTSVAAGAYADATKQVYELVVTVINHSESPQFVKELTIDCRSTGSAGYILHALDSSNLKVEPGGTFPVSKVIDPTDEIWSEGFTASAVLGTGKEVSSAVEWLDAELIELLGYPTGAITWARYPS